MLKTFFINIIGGKNFFIYKILSAFNVSITNYIKIFSLINKNSYLIFFYCIIKSQLFISFNPVKPSEKLDFQKKYSFKYPDFFSNYFNIWNNFLFKLSRFKYLELGTFEGRSALFVSELKNCEKIICVDPYIEYAESEKYEFKMSDVFNSVDQKLKKIKHKKINLIRKTSDDFFFENKEFFDVIYIDGYHQYDYVKRDFINSLNFLKKDGILICDDFLWFKYKKQNDNPIIAILDCYNQNKKNLEVLFISNQIIFKKLN